MRQYTLLADVLWDDLTDDQHALILDVTGEQIDGFLGHFADVPPSQATTGPRLGRGGHVLGHHLLPRGRARPGGRRRALQSLWLHRGQYLSDGVYAEGLLMLPGLLRPTDGDISLVETSFGERLEAFRGSGWTDSRGGRWPSGARRLHHRLRRRMGQARMGHVHAGLGPHGRPDARTRCRARPCFAHKFCNKYYYHGLTDLRHTALAQDWPSIVGACDDIDGMLPEDVEVEVVGGWLGSVRVGMPGSGHRGLPSSDAPSRFRQADQVMLK